MWGSIQSTTKSSMPHFIHWRNGGIICCPKNCFIYWSSGNKICRYLEQESCIVDNYVHWDNLTWSNKELYEIDEDLKKAWKACREPSLVDKIASPNYFLQDGFLFKREYFCIPRDAMWNNPIKVTRRGSSGHFGRGKILKQNNCWRDTTHQAWSRMSRLHIYSKILHICQLKNEAARTSRYTIHLPIPKRPFRGTIHRICRNY